MKKIAIIILISLSSSWQLGAQGLTDYLRMAAENNPGLKGKYHAFEAELQKIPQVGALPDTQLSFGYFVSPVETRLGPQRFNLSLMQRFPWFGTLEAKRNVAAAEAQVKYQVFLDARNHLFLQVALAYYQLYEIRIKDELLGKDLLLLESLRSIALKKIEHGQGKMVDVLRLDLQAEEFKSQRVVLDQKRIPLTTDLNLLLGREEDIPIQFPDSLPLPELDEGYRKDSIFIKNPRVTEVDEQIEAFAKREKLAEKQSLPSFGAGLTYINTGRRSDAAPAQNGRDALLPMVSMNIPLSRKKNQASLAEFQLRQKSLEERKIAIQNQILTEYQKAWFAIAQNVELAGLYDRQLNLADQTLNLLLAEYQNSGQSFDEVLMTHQSLVRYQLKKVDAETGLFKAAARLDFITAKDIVK